MPSECTTPAPLLVDAKTAAKLLSVGKTKLYELHAAGRVPLPIRLGRAVRWNAEELRRWADAGCPPRDRWQAMSKGRGRDGR